MANCLSGSLRALLECVQGPSFSSTPSYAFMVEEPDVKFDAAFQGTEVVVVKSGRRVCGSGGVLANAPILQDKAYFEVKLQQGGAWAVGLGPRERGPLERLLPVRAAELGVGGAVDTTQETGAPDGFWLLREDGAVYEGREERGRLSAPVEEGDVIGVSFDHVELVFYRNGERTDLLKRMSDGRLMSLEEVASHFSSATLEERMFSSKPDGQLTDIQFVIAVLDWKEELLPYRDYLTALLKYGRVIVPSEEPPFGTEKCEQFVVDVQMELHKIFDRPLLNYLVAPGPCGFGTREAGELLAGRRRGDLEELTIHMEQVPPMDSLFFSGEAVSYVVKLGQAEGTTLKPNLIYNTLSSVLGGPSSSPLLACSETSTWREVWPWVMLDKDGAVHVLRASDVASPGMNRPAGVNSQKRGCCIKWDNPKHLKICTTSRVYPCAEEKELPTDVPAATLQILMCNDGTLGRDVGILTFGWTNNGRPKFEDFKNLEAEQVDEGYFYTKQKNNRHYCFAYSCVVKRNPSFTSTQLFVADELNTDVALKRHLLEQFGI